jgi:hypothetical protein
MTRNFGGGSNKDNAAYQLTRAAHRDTWESVWETFTVAAKEGPTHRCWCCDRLWFKCSLTKVHKSALKEKELNYVFLSTVFAVEDSECGEICCACIRLIKIGNVLRTAIVLSSSVSRGHYRRREERCVALSIFLMQSSSLGTDRQVGLKGSVVNVPVLTLKKCPGVTVMHVRHLQ